MLSRAFITLSNPLSSILLNRQVLLSSSSLEWYHIRISFTDGNVRTACTPNCKNREHTTRSFGCGKGEGGDPESAARFWKLLLYFRPLFVIFATLLQTWPPFQINPHPPPPECKTPNREVGSASRLTGRKIATIWRFDGKNSVKPLIGQSTVNLLVLRLSLNGLTLGFHRQPHFKFTENHMHNKSPGLTFKDYKASQYRVHVSFLLQNTVLAPPM